MKEFVSKNLPQKPNVGVISAYLCGTLSHRICFELISPRCFSLGLLALWNQFAAQLKQKKCTQDLYKYNCAWMRATHAAAAGGKYGGVFNDGVTAPEDGHRHARCAPNSPCTFFDCALYMYCIFH